MNWTFSVPVWGDWHVKQYLDRVLAYHARMGLKGRYIIHTNRRTDIEPRLGVLKDCEIDFRGLPGNPDSYQTFAECHAEAFRESQACLFLTADAAFSEGSFEVVRKAVEEQGKKLIAMCSLRTCSINGDDPPFDPKGMNAWAVQHIHLPLKTLVWGHRPPSLKPTNLFFEDGENFWSRGFHLHPIAAVRDGRRVDLSGTVDGALVTAYWPDETWVVQNHEVAGCEFTHESKFGGDLSWNLEHPQYIADSMRDGAKSIHRHFFSHKIALRGEPNAKFDDVAREVYARL